MGIAVKISVLCDDRHLKHDGRCHQGASLEVELSDYDETRALVVIPDEENGWTFTRSSDGRVVRCPSCTETHAKGGR